MAYYTKTINQSLQELNSDLDGLSKIEASERLAQYGLNVITVRGEPLWRKLIEPFVDIFMAVLFVAVAISIWHHAYIDAAIIGAIMFINAMIYYVQRFSTERILRSLQKHDKLQADVMRENKPVRIDASLLVPGDVVILEEGEKIPADCRLLKVSSFRVDESQLTGESLPISKQTDELPDEKEIYEQTNMIFQGSFVVGGRAMALVVATGNDTEFGKLAVLTGGTSEHSPVQKKIDKLISQIVRVIAAVAAVAFGLALYRGMELGESIRYVLALSVSAVPESLAVSITVVLVIGMKRMAAKKALVRAMRAIETVGIVTTIATDKTGTLTKNKLTIQKIWHPNKTEREISAAIARSVSKSDTKAHDPLDLAMDDYVESKKIGITKTEVISRLPFDQAFVMSGNLLNESGKLTLWVKGSPESVTDRCKLTAAEKYQIESELRSLAGSGFRVIAMAHADVLKPINSFDDLPKSVKFNFDGFIAVADILRPEAKRAIATAIKAGITVRMVTGDHYETAYHIGRELGMVEHRNQVFDSRQMHEMSDEELAAVIDEIRVFARVIPEHKHRILAILKKNNITAMTGDGVNDVPALTSANVGVAMGSGASIAKDAGDIILLDDNFKSIVNAIHEGRTIYANIKRMVAYLLSTNAGEVIVAIASLVAGIPVPLAAVQILWINLVTDTCMVVPLGLEPGEKHNMNRPPQASNAPLFSRFMISRIVLVALVMSVLTLTIYVMAIESHGVDYARSIAFHALVVMQWASAFNYRSDYESLFRRIRRFSLSFYIGLFVAVSLQFLAISGVANGLLSLETLAWSDIVWVTSVAFIVPVIAVEIHKWIGRRFFNKGHLAK